jgi:hypothetical protein
MNSDTLTISRLPTCDQQEVSRWHESLSKLGRPIGQALAQLARDYGVSPQSARRKYDAWRARGLFGLVNASKHPAYAPSRQGNLHADTIGYYRQLCIENGRKCRPAYRKLVREYFEGAAIPGLPSSFIIQPSSLPDGWTYSNFQSHAPTPFECKAARQGLRAAAEYRPLVYTTRKEMHFFGELQFDDCWHDVECSLINRTQRVRPLQLGSMDVLTACLFEWCMKPRIRRDDDTRTNLNPHDMIFLLAAILGKYGHSPLGTRFNIEAGAATVEGAVIDLIHRLSKGQVKVRIGKTGNAAAFLGQYPGVAKGNFRTRALIESFWNLTHNETADRLFFPGQAGSHARVNAPEDLHGRCREQDLILRAMPALPARVIDTLRMPLPEFNAAKRAIDEINERMNQRGIMPGTEHAIEGFIEAGLVTTDFDLPGLGLVTRADFERRLADRSEAERNAIIALCVSRARKLSPREAFDLGVRGQLSSLQTPVEHAPLTRWRPEALAQLLYLAKRDGVSAVGKDHLVTIFDEEISPSPIRFLAHHFSPGDEFETVCNPMVPDMLFIYEPRPAHRGAWLGVLKSWGHVSKADPEATGLRIGQAEKVKRELLAPLIKSGDRLARERADMLEHNNARLTDAQAADQTAEDDIDAALMETLKP